MAQQMAPTSAYPAHNVASPMPSAQPPQAPPAPKPVTLASQPRRTRMSANMLSELYEEVAKNEGEEIQIIPLTQPNIEKVFEDFKVYVRDELGKSTLASQLTLMYVKLEEPDNVVMFCPTEMSIIFANTQRDIFLDYIKNQLKQFEVRVSVKLDPTFVQEVAAPEKPKSKMEIFAEMAERNKLILLLKKELNLQID